MKKIDRKVWGVAAVLAPLVIVFVFVVVRSGPLSPVEVTVARVESRSIQPALQGIGVVEARYVHKLGPTAPGRVARVLVDVGDMVRQGDVVCEMDPVDLEQQELAQQSLAGEAASSVAKARAALDEARARRTFAAAQEKRYAALLKAGAVSAETVELNVREAATARSACAAAKAALEAARQQSAAQASRFRALLEQREHLRLVAPTDGLVTVRAAEEGSSVVAGQTLIEIVDPSEIWVSARFDQHQATGLAAGLDASVTLRSRSGGALAGAVLRIEPVADPVTEELLARIEFRTLPRPLPPLGELAEVVVSQQPLPKTPVVPSAAIHRQKEKTGVWLVDGSRLRFREVTLGRMSRDGFVQVTDGLEGGERIVVYSMAPLSDGTRITIRKHLQAGGKS
ncbi:efflux RND transporter periplasmic adaptor subunit [Chlorobaculum sp. 24CR]|uniref:efflux RND transporter periplasmic adaptor subunit n=1 Tax=Chlorobaculum sp. 24CR TaxID=2508878 RepID=UPI00100A603E|nr:efflux RND transporter periplasmic adaptor subunit [Chlorobaculum sp. 24CR]RXK88372.1 efflux RND transporter periplasmic adaptor subunit [Chlorobaculum sp. 24CR]